MRLPFIGDSYNADTPVLLNEQNINLMFEPAPPSAVSTGALLMTPGVKSWTSVTGATKGRGIHVMNEELYVIYGEKLFKIASDGTATELGVVLGEARTIIADNGTQLVIVSDTKTYYYTRTTDTFAEITATNFLQASTVTYLDGYFVFSQEGTNQFFISGLMNDVSGLSDLTTFDATDRARAFSSPGNIEAIYADHKELWIFKDDNFIEIWQNTGGVDFPFTRLGGAFSQRGCHSKYTIGQNDNTLLWVGDDDIVYRAEGYVPSRVSNYAVERSLANLSSTDEIFAQTWEEGGHKLYGLWLPSQGTVHVYDLSNQRWHERQSKAYGYWRVNGIAECYDKICVTDSESGNVGELDFDTFEEYGSVMQAIRVGYTAHLDGARFSLDRLEVLFETGVGTATGDGSDPDVALFLSKDYGRSFGTMKKRSLGKIGEYTKRVVWRQQGAYKQVTPKILISDPVRRYIVDAYVELTPRRI